MGRQERRHVEHVATEKRYSEAEMKAETIKASNAATQHTCGMLLAAVCIALHDEFNFETQQCLKVLDSVDELCFIALCAAELEDECFEKTKIEMRGRYGATS